MLKKMFFLSMSSIIFFQTAQFAFAQNTGQQKTDHFITALQNQASQSAARSQTSLQAIINRADTMISVRITSLTNLSTRIQNDSRLTTDEKSSLSADVQSALSGLTNLKSKIDADTDVATARSDTKEIVTNYYVYEIFEPKIRLLIMLNNIQEIVSKLQILTPQLTSLANTLSSQGKNTSVIT